jgi:hypothetical protein
MEQVRSQLWVITAALTLDLFDDELELPFTSSCRTLRDRAVLSPKIRASYYDMLLVTLNSWCTMYLNCSPSGVRSGAPAPTPYLREEPSKKRVQ